MIETHGEGHEAANEGAPAHLTNGEEDQARPQRHAVRIDAPGGEAMSEASLDEFARDQARHLAVVDHAHAIEERAQHEIDGREEGVEPGVVQRRHGLTDALVADRARRADHLQAEGFVELLGHGYAADVGLIRIGRVEVVALGARDRVREPLIDARVVVGRQIAMPIDLGVADVALVHEYAQRNGAQAFLVGLDDRRKAPPLVFEDAEQGRVRTETLWVRNRAVDEVAIEVHVREQQIAGHQIEAAIAHALADELVLGKARLLAPALERPG